MRLIIPFILLAFPFAEIFLLVKLAHLYSWWLLLYLVVIAYLGLQLIRGEKLLMGPKMMQTLSAGGNPIKAMLGTARNMVAGVLLLIPGVISDAIAVILLLIPIQQTKLDPNAKASFDESPFNQHRKTSANDDVIEGEYTEVKEPKTGINKKPELDK